MRREKRGFQIPHKAQRCIWQFNHWISHSSWFSMNNIATMTFSICWTGSNIWKNYLQRCEAFSWVPMKKGILLRVSHPNGKEDRLLISKRKQREIIKRLKELMTIDFTSEATEIRWEDTSTKVMLEEE